MGLGHKALPHRVKTRNLHPSLRTGAVRAEVEILLLEVHLLQVVLAAAETVKIQLQAQTAMRILRAPQAEGDLQAAVEAVVVPVRLVRLDHPPLEERVETESH